MNRRSPIKLLFLAWSCSFLMTQHVFALESQPKDLSLEERQAVYHEKALSAQDTALLNLVPFSMNDQPEVFNGDELQWRNTFDTVSLVLAGLFAYGAVSNVFTEEVEAAAFTSFLLSPLLYAGGRLIGSYHLSAYQGSKNTGLQKQLELSDSQLSWKWAF